LDGWAIAFNIFVILVTIEPLFRTTNFFSWIHSPSRRIIDNWFSFANFGAHLKISPPQKYQLSHISRCIPTTLYFLPLNSISAPDFFWSNGINSLLVPWAKLVYYTTIPQWYPSFGYSFEDWLLILNTKNNYFFLLKLIFFLFDLFVRCVAAHSLIEGSASTYKWIVQSLEVVTFKIVLHRKPPQSRSAY
jgi:hypothetical protein